MKLSQFLIWSGVFMAVTGTAIIDSKLQQAYGNGKYGSPENVMITFDKDHLVVIEQINKQNFSHIHEKRSALMKAQQEFSNEVQGGLQNFLRSINVHYETFWINNKIYIPKASSDLVQIIANFPGVAKIEKEVVITLDPKDSGQPEIFVDEAIRPENTVEWGIKRIHADKVWSKGFKGKGIVVANIDTGVRYTHEALKGRWREKHGWFDPYTKTTKPTDEDGHGTHTMATITGTHGVGVAPEATWISCRGCGLFGCTESALLGCGQWILCPTDHLGRNADCMLAPHLVSNSWNFHEFTNKYDSVIASWRAAGIIPIFSMGNSGAKCGTVNSPANVDKVIGVGNIDKNNRIAQTSSCGPTKDGKTKPDISAPGTDIRSASNKNDNAYRLDTGTSMACPHVSGTIALMLQKSPNLTYEKIYRAITANADHTGLDHTGAPETCGGASNSKFPNNVFGYGIINAEKAVGAV